MTSSTPSQTTSAAKGPQREQWGSQLGFLMAAVGSAIGLGNIWRFPGVTYANGGGAFVIPYIVALLSAGIPILLLDYALGHRYRGSAPSVFRRLSPRLEWLGWWQVLVSFVIMTYYAVVIAWSLRYVFYSMSIAWKEHADGAKGFFFNEFIQVSETVTYSPTPVWNVFLPLAAIWAIVIFVIAKGVTAGVEKANKVFLPLLAVLFLFLVLRALMLPGATDGLNELWTPNFSALGDPQVWIAAYAQIFYSLSVGFGIMLTYSSYLRRRSNLVGTGLVAAFANSSFEVLAGFGVFATLGFMAHQQGVGVGDLEGLTGISLSFVTFPTVIAQMPGGVIFGVLFFLSLTLAGITSLISLVQVVAAGIGEKLHLAPRRAAVVVGAPAAAISLLVFGTTTGIYSLDVVDAYINQIGVVSSAILMCFIVALWARKLPVLQRHLNTVSETGRAIGLWWQALVGYIVPTVLAYMLIDTLYKFITVQYDASSYTRAFEGVFGWGVVALALAGAFVMTAIPWKTRVDDFQPLDLDTHKTTKDVS